MFKFPKFPKVKHISLRNKIKMFNAVHYYCEEYDVPLDTLEDAENFWEPLRYPDLVDYKEEIVCSAIKFKRKTDDKWCIYTGKRHGDVFYRMYLDKIDYDKASAIQGFMTSKDRFVDRFEGLRIAKSADQYHDTDSYPQDQLYSEDIWPEGIDEIYEREPRGI